VNEVLSTGLMNHRQHNEYMVKAGSPFQKKLYRGSVW